MAHKLKSQVQSAFKMHGLSLRSDACGYLCEVLASVSSAHRDDDLERLIDAVQKQPLNSSLVDRVICQNAVQECNKEHDNTSDTTFVFIDAFNVPRLSYNTERKKFLPCLGPPPSLFGDADDKANLYRERYKVLLQRTSRHELFTAAAIGTSSNNRSNRFELKPVEHLLGSTASLGEIIVLGMLTQLKEGKWYLEDSTGSVQLNLSRANFHTGLFTENCFVLAEGVYEDDVFQINAFGFPPPESAKSTMAYFGNINFFGGDSPTCAKSSVHLKQLEAENEDAMMVYMSDISLDLPKVLEKLRVLFSGLSETPPVCFVFCGNFTSQPYGPSHVSTLRDSLLSLADILLEFPSLVEKSYFVFVPGPQDPGLSSILPRPSIPQCITRDFQSKITNAVFTTNPCRIQYCTQEIVVFREDIVTKMCRNCVRFPSDGKIPTHFTKTLICQAHLCPLPLHVQPVYWSHDHALRLYPLPDLVVCADKYDTFTETQVDCTVTNPSSFTKNGWSFQVYYPASGQVEDSRIEDQQ